MHIDRAQLHTERRSCSPNYGPLSDPDLTLNFAHDTDARDLRRDLPEQLQPLGAQAKFELGEAGGVGPRPRHALNEARADRIDSLGHYDRHCVANLLQDERGRADPGHDPFAPIFIADSISLAVSREKDGKLRIVYAGWDNANVVEPGGYGQARRCGRADPTPRREGGR